MAGLSTTFIQRLTWLRIGLREFFLVTAIVAISLAWWQDRRRSEVRLELARLQSEFQRPGRLLERTSNRIPERPSLDYVPSFPSPFATSGEFVAFVAQHDTDWSELGSALVRVRPHPQAKDAAADLVRLLDHNDNVVRARAAIALGTIRAEPVVAVPALVALLDHRSLEVRRWAASGLGEFRGEARSAIPALEKIMLDDDSEMAALAGLCISMIDPERNLGVRYRQLLTNRHRNNRLLAIREIRYYVPPRDCERLLTDAFAVERDPDVRIAIARAMPRLK